ncbi:MAG: calcium/sodium antiporter [Ruminococcaceae bacterium]|nr:calcium/sodium antiporter [Oscillospiraceae bacterium]
MDLIIPIILFIIGLVFLIKGGDWFVDAATGIAHRLHIPEILIGATVVSIGTTLPEVMVSATGAIQGQGAMAYGNAIGSIICNTALISALTIAIRPSGVNKKTLLFPTIFFFCSAIFYSLIAYIFGEFPRWSGIVLLLGFVAYMTVLIIQAFKERKPKEKITGELIIDVLDDEVEDDKQSSVGDFVGFLIVGLGLIATQVISIISAGGLMTDISNVLSFASFYLNGILGILFLAIGIAKAIAHDGLKLLNSNVLFLILGAAIIAIGATLLVDNGTIIAERVGVPSSVIALTFVALGTSLPELVTAVTSLLKGHSALSLGNIIGANIFNLVLVSGTSITISPFKVPADKYISGINSSFVIDIPLMISVMAIMTLPSLIRGKLARWQGVLLLGIYAAFCVFQFVF